MKVITLKIENVLYFLSEDAHKSLIQIDNPSKRAIQQLSEVVIDTELLEIIKCRKRIEDVIVFGLKKYLRSKPCKNN